MHGKGDRQRGGCLGILSECSSFGVMESTPCLSLAAAISWFPGRSEGILSPCATARSEESVCNFVKCQEFSVFTSAALPLIFPLQSDSHLPVHPHTSRVLGQSFVPLYPTRCCPPSFASRSLDHSHGHCIGFLMRSNCYHCVNHSFCFSLPLHPILWLLMYNIMLGNMNCLVAANRRQQWFSQRALSSDTFPKAEETISVGNVCVIKPVWLAQEIRMINKEAGSIRVKPHSYCRRNIWERKTDRAPEMKTPRECPLLPPVPEQPLHLPDSCHEDSLYCIPFPFFFLVFHCSFLFFLSHFHFLSLNLWIFSSFLKMAIPARADVPQFFYIISHIQTLSL